MADNHLLESGDVLLLESGSNTLHEGAIVVAEPPSTILREPAEEEAPLFVPRTWIDFTDDMDAEAMNDLEGRIAYGLGIASAEHLYPETFGAVGDGLTDDTVALQACIDAAMALNADAVVQLDSDKTYLVDGAPQTDHFGNCILQIDGGAFSTKRLALVASTPYARGQDQQMPIIKTTRNADTLFPLTQVGLAAQLNAGATTATCDAGAAYDALPTSGAVICESETILYSGKNTGAHTLTGLTRGVMGDDVTHADTRNLFFTYGPPSVIGGRTVENGQDPGTEYTGIITIENIRIEIAGNPTLAGIDATSWGGLETNAVVKGFDGDAGIPKIAGVVTLPSHPWAFGIRTPTGSNYGYTKLRNTLVSGMYAGHVFTACDHTTFSHAHTLYCHLAYGFEIPIDRRHDIGGGYTMSEYNPVHLAGWTPSTGIDDIPASTGICHVTGWVLDMELSFPAQDPTGVFTTTTVVQDLNNMIYGDITIHHNTVNIAPFYTTADVNGAAHLKIRVLHDWRSSVTAASAADLRPSERISLVTNSTTAINYLTSGYIGQVVSLVFQAATPVHHNQGSPTTNHSPILLHDSTGMTAASGTVLTLIYDGDSWQEMSRKDP